MTTANDWIGTFTGERFYPLRPNPMSIDIEDIAHGLAGRFRFSGQSRDWYTVAQHSVEVSRRVPAADALWGLLHDAAEAYLPDIPRPIKKAFMVEVDHGWPANGDRTGAPMAVRFELVEDMLLLAVARRFGLLLPIPLCVQVADDRELARERRDLFDKRQPAWDLAAEPYPEPLVPAAPREAEAMFLERFEELRA